MRIHTPTARKNNTSDPGALFNQAKVDCYISPLPSLFHLSFPCSFLLPSLPSPASTSLARSGLVLVWRDAALGYPLQYAEGGFHIFVCVLMLHFCWCKNKPEHLNPVIDPCIREFTLSDVQTINSWNAAACIEHFKRMETAFPTAALLSPNWGLIIKWLYELVTTAKFITNSSYLVVQQKRKILHI